MKAQSGMPGFSVNVGVMGHVDAGKTSLVKAISTHLSTAALDKHPVSRERGITIDLGFSSMIIPASKQLRLTGEADSIQITLVDCPGHASLLRTIIGGAQIIDMVILVVDATHGIQAQTVECVVIAEICTGSMIIVLNKIDMIPEAEREQTLAQQQRKIRAQLRGSKFVDSPLLCVAAAVGGEKAAAISRGRGSKEGQGEEAGEAPWGLLELRETLQETIRVPRRRAEGPLFMAVDHCFPIKGQGTVLTGTVLTGHVAVGDKVELPRLGEQRKVKSMQTFRQSVHWAKQGDRVGVCLTSLDAKLLERGVLCTPGTLRPISRAIASIRKVRAFRGTLRSGAKVHCSVGHATAMARVTFFGAQELETLKPNGEDRGQETKRGLAGSLREDVGEEVPQLPFFADWDYRWQEELGARREGGGAGMLSAPAEGGQDLRRSGRQDVTMSRFAVQYVLLEFETPVWCPMCSLLIASRLDAEVGLEGGIVEGSTLTGLCRIGFFGTLVQSFKEEELGRIGLYKEKMREGSVQRVIEGGREVVGQGLFKKETDLSAFIGMSVETANGQRGLIESRFGQSGKFKVRLEEGGRPLKAGEKLYLRFRKYVWREKGRMVQVGEARKAGKEGLLGTGREEGGGLDVVKHPLEPSLLGERLDLREESGLENSLDTAEKPQLPESSQSGTDDALRGTTDDFTQAFRVREELREGVVDSVKSEGLVITKGLFSMEEDIRKHVGQKVVAVEFSVEGNVVGPFGRAGKAKVQFPSDFVTEVGQKVVLHYVRSETSGTE